MNDIPERDRRPVSREDAPYGAAPQDTDPYTALVNKSRTRQTTAQQRAAQRQQPSGARPRSAASPGHQAASSRQTSSNRQAPANRQAAPVKRKKKSGLRTFRRIVGRTLLVILTVVLVAVGGLCMIMDEVFNGPSETARDMLTMSLLEASATKWIPGLFIGNDMVEQIRGTVAEELPDNMSDTNQVVIRPGGSGGAGDEWKDCPDGIKIIPVKGDTFNAYVMLIRDPSQVYTAISSDSFSMDKPGTRINNQFETEGAIAAINGGAFFDNGTSSPSVGSVPCGLVVSNGKVVWDDGSSYDGFVGFTEDNILVVAQTMTRANAMEQKIRDGCCYGPVLIMNGNVNEQAYNTNSGKNPRTAIGQRADGTVIFLCVDGRQPGALGATYSEIIDIFVEYGAVNACNLDGGSSTVMLYRDTYGRYGEAGQTQMINNYSLLQAEPRRMPTFFMVRPSGSN